MRTVTLLGFIIIGKCINNEMILNLNECSILSISLMICIVADSIYFIKMMTED
jgi:hypothetical protein